MIAEVYPIRRMPRRMNFFDYTIPKDMEVCVGDIVQIPLRKTIIRGVVKRLKKTSAHKRLSGIESVYWKGALTSADLQRLERIAALIIQPVSNLLHIMYKDLKSKERQPTILPGIRPTFTKQEIEQAKSDDVFLYGNLHEAILKIKQLSTKSGQTLILCPREELAESLARLFRTHAYTGSTKRPEREWIIRAWHGGNISLLFGTRNIALYPASNLKQVLIIDPAAQEYNHLEQNPRFHPVHCAEELAKTQNATLKYIGPYPRIDLQTEHRGLAITLTNPIAPNQKTDYSWLSQTLERSIRHTLDAGKTVVLLLNRKGFAKVLECRDCSHVPFCGACGGSPIVRSDDLKCTNCSAEMWIPKRCPSCNKDSLKEGGVGNARIAELLSKRLNLHVGLLDADHPKLNDRIVIATDAFFSYTDSLQQLNIGLIAELRADLRMQPPDQNSFERLRYSLNRSYQTARDLRSNLVIQSTNPDLLQELLSAEGRMQELESRAFMHSAPFSYHIECSSLPKNIPEGLEIIQESDTIVCQVLPRNWTKIQSFLMTLPDSITLINRTQYEPHSGTSPSE